MIRIVFICCLISIGLSEDCWLEEAKLLELQKSFSEASAYMEKQDRSDGLIVLGLSRFYKRVVFNYLMGNESETVELLKYHYEVDLEDIKTPGPDIGAGTLCNAKDPSRWTSNVLSNLSIWDPPGVGDSRGWVTDIANAFCLYELLKKVNALKVVLVIDFFDASAGHDKPITNLLNYLETFFGPSFESYFSSVTVIFYSTPITDHLLKDVDENYMYYALEKQFLEENIPALSENGRKFINYLRQNKNHLGYLGVVPIVGDIPTEIGTNIFEAIKESSFVRKEYIKNLHPNISQTAKLCVYSARKNLLRIPKLGELHTFVANLLNEQQTKIKQVNINSSSNELERIRDDLLRIRALLGKFEGENLDANEGIDLLASIHPSVAMKIKKDDLVKDINLSLFFDRFLQLGESEELRLDVKTIISSSLAIIENSITKALFKYGEINEERYEKNLAELKKKCKKGKTKE